MEAIKDGITTFYTYSAVIIENGKVLSLYGHSLAAVKSMIDNRYRSCLARIYDEKNQRIAAIKQAGGDWFNV